MIDRVSRRDFLPRATVAATRAKVGDGHNSGGPIWSICIPNSGRGGCVQA